MNTAQLRAQVQDLFQPKAWIYWIDFVVSISIAWSFFFLTQGFSELSLLQVASFFISAFAFYRAALFIHEVSHLKPGAVPGFAIVWNLLCGIPVMFPSFTYKGVHSEHHKGHTYGTAEDGEYIPFGAGSRWKIVGFLAQVFLIPVFLVIRFGIITPISFLHPKLRLFVMERMSALAIDFAPKRRIPRGSDLVEWYWQEILCCLWVWFVAYLFATEALHTAFFTHAYLLMVTLLMVNSIRTLAAHRYRNREGQMTFENQVLDSVNVVGNFVTGLWAPVGLRYHGLHHLFPTMPYHSLAEAHRRLVEVLPADSVYHRTVETSLLSTLSRLWKDAQVASAQEPGKPIEQSR